MVWTRISNITRPWIPPRLAISRVPKRLACGQQPASQGFLAASSDGRSIFQTPNLPSHPPSYRHSTLRNMLLMQRHRATSSQPTTRFECARGWKMHECRRILCRSGKNGLRPHSPGQDVWPHREKNSRNMKSLFLLFKRIKIQNLTETKCFL